ncbi:TetR/AcrR family transcriptional regulator [Latilactobacillus fuchuensis]|uniref:TetR/AcrR family transcriptional regulator n=1 Tax=Latilactobacillus fuchuensis TaxID=164393 RepID=UPI0007054624|nr:TetR/AcrR family transcriptional regulator [Latilactobacillus fuchuensis]
MDNKINNNITDDLLYKNSIPIGKKKILIAAIELFYEQGFDRTSTLQIAKRSGISEGTIYKHFRSKRGLLNAIIDPMISNLLSNCNDSFIVDTDINIKEVISTMVKNKMDYIYNNRKILKILMIELLTNDTIYSEVKSRCNANYPLISSKIHMFLKGKNISDDDFLRTLVSDLLYGFFKMIFCNNYGRDQLKYEMEDIAEDVLNYIN